MLTVSSNIDAASLQQLLENNPMVVFEDTLCTVTAAKGSLVGDSPYGYIDFMMPTDKSAVEALVLWAKSWRAVSPNYA
jgi:hypothetical protein